MKILLLSCHLIPDQFFSLYKSKSRAFLHMMVSKATYHRSLSLPILAAVTPKEHQIISQNIYNKNTELDEEYDIVGIECTTTNSNFAYKIADEFRQRGIAVVLGGWHPSALPYEAKQHANAVVIGEAEEIWPQLLKDFQNGKLKQFYWQKKPVDPDNIPVISFSSPSRFLPAVQATRGCPTQCEFCAETVMKFRKRFRARPLHKVIEEIKSIPSRYFIFHDASLTINPDYTKQLFRGIKGLNKKFFCNGNVDRLGQDDKLLELAKEAGCCGWLIGFESISQKTIDMLGKKTNKVDGYINTIKKIHDKGMMVSGSFIFGFDQDTSDVFDNTLEFVNNSEIDVPDAMTLTPFPGTPLYKRLKKEKRILTEDWSKYDHRQVVFKPKNMSPQDLFSNIKRVNKEFYSLPNISRRVINSIRRGHSYFLSTLAQNFTMATLEFNSKDIS